MTADLPPAVRDRAIAAAGAILCDWVGLTDALKWAAPPVVDAVVSVVAPEIARPLQAQLDQSRKVYAEFVTGQHEEALTRIEELEAALNLINEAMRTGLGLSESLANSRAVLAAGETKPDKRDECGCHKGCTMLPHDCEKPCTWPDCLTEAEQQKLADDVMKDNE